MLDKIYKHSYRLSFYLPLIIVADLILAGINGALPNISDAPRPEITLFNNIVGLITGLLIIPLILVFAISFATSLYKIFKNKEYKYLAYLIIYALLFILITILLTFN